MYYTPHHLLRRLTAALTDLPPTLTLATARPYTSRAFVLTVTLLPHKRISGLGIDASFNQRVSRRIQRAFLIE